MPLTDCDVNVSRRNSRLSSKSAGSRPSSKPQSLVPDVLPNNPSTNMAKSDTLKLTPGVMSMLKGSTELGTESLIMPGSRFSGQNRASARRSGTASRLSTGSSHSQHSRPASGQHGHHGHHAWPSMDSGGRRMSITSNFSNLNAPQHYLDGAPPPSLGNLTDTASLPPPASYFRDNGRSQSLTNSVHHPAGFANYRSLSSLRGQEPYHRPRSPYRYPTRLKRPGYRPASPAMSDGASILSSRTHHHRLGSGLRMPYGAHGGQGSHGGIHGPHMYQNLRPSPLYYGPRNRSSPSVNSIGPLENMPGMYSQSLPASRQGTPSIADYPLPTMTPTHGAMAQFYQHSSDTPSSTPPTPHHQAVFNRAEPMIMANLTTSTRRGSDASNAIPAYYDYSENFESAPKPVMQVPQDSSSNPPTLGFVQRIRTILEERRVQGPVQANGGTEPSDLGERAKLGYEVHELPASPVIKRITRDLIRSTLLPTSDSERSMSPAVPTILREQIETAEAGSYLAPVTSPPTPIPAIIVQHAHRRTQSKASGHGSHHSDTTAANVAMDYMLRHSPPPEPLATFEDGNTMSDVLRNYGHEDTHMSTVIEEPTEPVTTAVAEVEVAAPTPTQPRWKTNFDTPPDMLRPHSAAAPSSVYSRSEQDISSRHSTPLMATPWPVSVPVQHSARLSRAEVVKQADVVSETRPNSAVPVKDTISTQIEPANPLATEPAQQAKRATDFLTSPVSSLSEMDVDHFNNFSPSPVSPLLPAELATNRRDSNVSSIWSHRKPLPKRPDSPASISSGRASIRESAFSFDQGTDRDSYADMRFSALGFRPLTRHLDDVKEEPSLETSTVDLRASTFKFPLPKRKSSLAHYEEFRLSRESKRQASVELPAKTVPTLGPVVTTEKALSKDQSLSVPPGATTLRDLRSIPSLHFSRMDLFSKLNDTLEFHPDNTSDEQSDTNEEGPDRPESTGVMRLKYRSFFESLDNMASDPVETLQAQREIEKLREASDHESDSKPRKKQVVLPKIKQWTPDDLMAEIDRLSIPSINGLTHRLSELLPSLRRQAGDFGDAIDADETVRSALDEIRRLGAELLPGGRPSYCSMTDDSDEHYEDTTSTISQSAIDSGSDLYDKVKTRPRSASSPGEVTGYQLAELEARTPTAARSQSVNHRGNGRVRDSAAFTEHSRSSRRSLLGSPPESQPWNLDTSYPWAANLSPIDISLPAPSTRRDHVKPRPSRLRLRDDATASPTVAAELTAATFISSPTYGASGADTFSQTRSHRRRHSKRSILGSISRKIRLPRATSIDNSGYATGPDILRGEDRTVDPGDRYPTTGLSPPSALNLDEVRSFFSETSSHSETEVTIRGVSLRKRFSNLKTKLPPMSRTHSALEQRALPSVPILRRSNSLFFAGGPSKQNDTVELDTYFDEASGMPKTEVRAKKLVNRMKTLWYKGGELLRSLSGKRKPRNIQEWDESSESAVWSNV